MLRATDLTCLKGDRLLFCGLDLELEAGGMLRVTGANGIGKTSLLRLLAGLARPEAGEVRWRGAPIARRREEFQRELLYLGHAPGLNDLLDPFENLRFACAAAGDAADGARCREALARIGLAEQIDLPARVLSQGQRRRVGLARLFLARRRTLWILDEPFSALDAAAVDALAALLSAHCAAGGMVILTTHQDAPFARAPAILDLARHAVAEPADAGSGPN